MSSQFPLRAPVQRQRNAGLTSRRNVVSQSSLALCALASALTLSITTSQTADAPTFGVLLQQLLTRTLILSEQQANAEAARLDTVQSRKWLNSKIDVFSEDLNAPSNDGQSPCQITLSISQPLEPGSGWTSRITVSDRDSDVVEARRREAGVLWIAKLTVVCGAVEAVQGRQRVATGELSRASDDLRAARTQVEADKEVNTRVAQTEVGAAATCGTKRATATGLAQALEEPSALAGSQERFTGITGSPFSTAADVDAVADGPPTLRVA